MKVFYRPEMSAFTESFSPSSSKPQWVVQDWQNDPLINCEICSFPPATRAQICSVHDEDYVDGVLSCRYSNGFGNYDPAIAASLPYVAGSMVHAAEHAIRCREVVCSPSSGSHHAGIDFGAGYCSFNALLIAAMVMKQKGLVNRVAILDADRHEGDGTDQIIRHHGLKWIVHRTQGKHFNNRSDCLNGRYMRWLNMAIDDCLDCDLILYQAGVDGHINDPLGGLHTSEELAERDRLVFEGLGQLPMVINLAGGYQSATGETAAQRLEPVLALHRQTARIHTELFPA
jgi:acetoin utilization deacetylase AcuC-like enzyme